MSNKDLKRIIKNHYDKLCYIQPLIGSEKFVTNSYRKWACLELLREIEKSEGYPFQLTPIELLQNFSEKMKLYAGKKERNCLIFIEASNLAEYFIEESWKYISKSSKRKEDF